MLAAPFVWVATELGRTYLFTGFPWVLLGYSQTSVLPVAQFASVLGVYGLSGLVAAASAAVTYAAGSLRLNGSGRNRRAVCAAGRRDGRDPQPCATWGCVSSSLVAN